MAAGYSATPLAKKLGIRNGTAIVAINPPADYLDLLSPLPTTASFADPAAKEIDVVHLFTNDRNELQELLSRYVRQIKQNGSIWVSWYKKAAKLPTDVTEDAVRSTAFPLGLVDIKVCAVDEKWSGLKLVIRKENRI